MRALVAKARHAGIRRVQRVSLVRRTSGALFDLKTAPRRSIAAAAVVDQRYVRSMIERRRLPLLLTTALCLQAACLGCAGFGQRTVPPEVSLVDLRPLPSESLEQRFEVKIRVVNPNDVELAGDGVDLILEINERRLGRAVSSESFLIPRLGDEVILLVATASWLDVLRQVVALPEARGIEYTLRGRLFLADSPTWLSFEHEGSLLAELLPRAE